jgi:hypothetical protein
MEPTLGEHDTVFNPPELSQRGLQLKDLVPGNRGDHTALAGFMGQEEDIVELLREDDAILERLGVTYEQLGNTLGQLIIEESIPGGTTKDLNSEGRTLRIKTITTPGLQRSPGLGNEANTRTEVAIIDMTTGMEWHSLSGLHPHLLTTHRFAEGRGTSYRLEPINAVLLTGIDVDKNTLKEEATTLLKRRLREDQGLRVGQLHNFLILCADDEEMPGLLYNYLERHIDIVGPINNFLRFVKYIDPELRTRYRHIVESMVKRISPDNPEYLKARQLLRVVEYDTDYPMINGGYLPDYIQTKDQEDVNLCKRLGPSLMQWGLCMEQGNEYWIKYAETYAENECRYNDPSEFTIKRMGFETGKNIDTTGQTSPYRDIYRTLYDSSFPSTVEEDLVVREPGVIFANIERYCEMNGRGRRTYQGKGRLKNRFNRQMDDVKITLATIDESQKRQRLHFYEWGRQLAVQTGDLRLLAYCTLQVSETHRYLGDNDTADSFNESLDEMFSRITRPIRV